MSASKRIVFMVLAFCALTSQADSTTWINLPAGLNYNLVLEGDGSMSTRIPVAYAVAKKDVPKDGLALGPLDIVYKEGRSAGLAAAFDPKFSASGPDSPPSLTIRVPKPAHGVWPGTYQISTFVRPVGDLDASKQQPISLTLQRPAPVLSASSTVVVGKVQALFGGDESKAGTLRLAEQSGKVGTTNLSLTEYHDIAGNAMPDTGRLVVGPLVPSRAGNTCAKNAANSAPSTGYELAHDASVPAGGIRAISLVPCGAFPLGKTAGKIEIRSPDLAAPMFVNYEVRTRRDLLLILVIAVIGAVFGWLVRFWLAGVQALATAMYSASLALAAMARHRADCEDKEFRKKLESFEQILHEALAGKNSQKITDAAKTAQDNTSAAIVKLEQDTVAANKLLEPFQQFADAKWNLPSAIMTDFEAFRAEVHRIEELIDRRNVTEANAALKRMDLNGLTPVVNSFKKYCTDLAVYLEKLVSCPPVVRKEEFAELKKLSDMAKSEFPSPLKMPPSIKIDQAWSVFNAANDVFGGALLWAERVPRWSEEFVAMTIELGLAEPNSGEQAEVGKETRAYSDAIADGLRNPFTAAATLPGQWQALEKAWVDFLYAASPLTDKEKAAIHQKLEDGDWWGALKMAAEKKITIYKSLLPPIKPDEILSKSFQDIVGFNLLEIEKVVNPEKHLISQLKGTPEERIQLERWKCWAAAGQSAFFAALFIAGVYVVYADTWVGTYKEMLALFVFAFSIDLTSDSVLSALKKLKVGD